MYEWTRGRMKGLDFMDKRLHERNEARTYINNVDETMLEYYRVFAKQIKLLPPEHELSDFYHPSENQKNGELLFVVVGTGVATYALYRRRETIRQTKRNYTEDTMSLIVFRLVARQ